MAEKLTELVVRRFIKHPPKKGARPTFLWDSDVPGFGVKLSSEGRATFSLFYRTLEGRQRVYGLGLITTWPTVAKAREEAAALLRKVRGGDDPMGSKHTAKAAPSVNDLCDRYERECLPKLAPSTAKEWRRKMLHGKKDDQRNGNSDRKKELGIRPKLGRIKVAKLTYDDVQALHSEISARGSLREANATVGVLRTMLNRAIVWKYIQTNPCTGVQFNPDIKRERYLNTLELAALVKALVEHPNRQAANAVRLLMLTGARRGEVLGARWDQFDFEAGTWSKLAGDTKQRKSHLVPLPAVAVQLLTEIKAAADLAAKKNKKVPPSPFVFPSHGESGHLVELKRDWAALRKATGISDVRLHDLRHSYASVLVSSGLSLPIIGKMLGHASVATTQRYAHLALDPLKQAAERAAAIIEGRPSAEVIPLGSRK